MTLLLESQKSANSHGTKMIKYRTLILASLVGLMAITRPALAGTNQEDAARYYEDALKRFEQNDSAGAIIQLKNSLQKDPSMLTARVLLGKAYLRQADPAAAENELNRALQLGVDRSEVVVPLAQAFLRQTKYKELLERFRPDGLPTAQRVELLISRGQAYRALGDTTSALRSYQDALVLDPGSVPALLAQADLFVFLGKAKDARVLVERALSLAPNDVSAWNVKAGVALAAGDTEGALAAFAKCLTIAPQFTDARLGRATLLIGLGRDAEAVTDLEYLQRERPKDPSANYLRSVYLARKGDEAGSRAALQDVILVVDPIPRTVLKQQHAASLLLIGGLAHYGLREVEKARIYLQDYLGVNPGHPGARRLLGSILLSQGDIKGAISTLELAHRAAPSDPQVLSLLASAEFARKDYRAATRYLEQALQVGEGAADVHATLGFSLLGIGQRDLALDHLRQAFDKDPGQYNTGAALAVLYLRNNQPKEALAVAEAIVQRDPSNVFVQNLLGLAKASVNDTAGARAAYLKAIAADPRFVAAQLNLGKLELLERNLDAARERFLGILKARPKDTQAMYELARVEDSAGRTEEAVRWLEKAHALNRRDTRVTTQLVEHQIALKNFEGALNAANETRSVLPDNLDALSALGVASIARGDIAGARGTFARMEVLVGDNADGQYRIAEYYFRIGDQRAAIRCLTRALSAEPDYLPALILLTELDIQSGDLEKAGQRAKAITARYPNRAIGKRLLADIAMARKNYPAAVAGYKSALEVEPSTDDAIRLFNAYVQSGSPAKATEYMESWVQAHPDDAVAIEALAEGNLRAGNLAAARSGYEKLLKVAGEQASVLNNLANILLKQGDANALSYAEKAHARAPNDSSILDTLGWVLIKQGQPDKALRYLREARLRGPRNDEIRYHLAVALSQTGHEAEARAELEPLMSGATNFDGSQEARKLWRELATR